MSKMSNIDLTVKEGLKAIRDIVFCITAIIIIILMALLDYGKTNITNKNTINNIEERLTKQEHYMHQVQADIHEFKEQEVLGR